MAQKRKKRGKRSQRSTPLDANNYDGKSVPLCPLTIPLFSATFYRNAFEQKS